MARRLNVLITAHEFSPFNGSECAEGWMLVNEIAKYHNVTVIFATGSQKDNTQYIRHLEIFLKSNILANYITFINIDQPFFSIILSRFNFCFFKRGVIGLPILYFLAYKLWEYKTYLFVKKLIKFSNFDIIHHLTQISFREPGFLWKLGIPFVWGPTGGYTSIPFRFWLSLPFKVKVFELVRFISNIYQFNYSKNVKSALSIAATIYTFTDQDFKRLLRCTKGNVYKMTDSGSYSNMNDREILKSTEKIKILWVGQLIERKSPFIFLDSIPREEFYTNQIEITIIGDGYLRKKLIKYLKNNSLNVNFILNVDHHLVLALLAESNVLVHTSYREAASNIILEAMSTGNAIICHDIDGIALAVDENCGIKVPLVSKNESVIGFNFGIKYLIENRDFLYECQYNALKRAKHISWEQMARKISKDYLNIIK